MKYQCEEVLNFMELKYRASMHASYAYASSFFDNRACVELDMMVSVTCVSKVKLQFTLVNLQCDSCLHSSF